MTQQDEEFSGYELLEALNSQDSERIQDVFDKLRVIPMRQVTRLLETVDENDQTSLIVAIRLGQYRLAMMLTQLGSNVNHMSSCEEDSGNPLFFATWSGNEELVNTLLYERGNPFRENMGGSNAIDIARSLGHFTILRVLEKWSLFSGFMQLQVKTLGMKYERKVRVHISPRDPYHSVYAGETRLQLCIYKNITSTQPRCICYIENAIESVITDGDGIVRKVTLDLPQGYGKPDLGYGLYMNKQSQHLQITFIFGPNSQYSSSLFLKTLRSAQLQRLGQSDDDSPTTFQAYIPPPRPPPPQYYEQSGEPSPSARPPSVQKQRPPEGPKQPMCVLCMEEPATFSFLHEDEKEAHMGICESCKNRAPQNCKKICPICKKKVKALVRVYQ